MASDAVLEAILDTCDDAVIYLDRDGRITRWNRSAERQFGHGADEVVGQAVTAVFPEHVREAVDGVLRRVRSGDRAHHVETEILRRDGMPMPVSLSLSPVAGQGDDVVGSVLIGRDITEQRLAQAALAEAEARVRESEALAHVGSWLWDLRTGAVQWSDEFHRIHGLDPHEFDGTFAGHLAAVHPDDRAAVQAAMDASVRSARPFEAEYRIVRPDGEVREVHARAQPTAGSSGAVVGLRGIGQDVTDGPRA